MSGADEEAVVYMLRCADGTLYTGWTNDIKKRLAAHNAGTAAKYTKPRRPVTLAYLEPCDGKSAALRREAAIKRLPKSEKERMVAEWAVHFESDDRH